MLNEFKRYLEDDSVSENTIMSYISDVTIFLKFFKEKFGEEIIQLEHIVITEYIKELKNASRKSNTINRKLSALCKYNNFIIQKGKQENIVIKPYRQKVSEFLLSDNLSLLKIKTLEELSDNEFNELKDEFFNKMGSETDFKSLAGGLSLLTYIRREIGIDEQAIRLKFGEFLNKNVLTEEQYGYCMMILDYAKMNGDITMPVLANEEPFASYDFIEIFDVNKIYAKKLVDGLHKPIDKK